MSNSVVRQIASRESSDAKPAQKTTQQAPVDDVLQRASTARKKAEQLLNAKRPKAAPPAPKSKAHLARSKSPISGGNRAEKALERHMARARQSAVIPNSAGAAGSRPQPSPARERQPSRSPTPGRSRMGRGAAKASASVRYPAGGGAAVANADSPPKVTAMVPSMEQGPILSPSASLTLIPTLNLNGGVQGALMPSSSLPNLLIPSPAASPASSPRRQFSGCISGRADGRATMPMPMANVGRTSYQPPRTTGPVASPASSPRRQHSGTLPMAPMRQPSVPYSFQGAMVPAMAREPSPPPARLARAASPSPQPRALAPVVPPAPEIGRAASPSPALRRSASPGPGPRLNASPMRERFAASPVAGLPMGGYPQPGLLPGPPAGSGGNFMNEHASVFGAGALSMPMAPMPKFNFFREGQNGPSLAPPVDSIRPPVEIPATRSRPPQDMTRNGIIEPPPPEPPRGTGPPPVPRNSGPWSSLNPYNAPAQADPFNRASNGGGVFQRANSFQPYEPDDKLRELLQLPAGEPMLMDRS